jgi:hypothetical protein
MVFPPMTALRRPAVVTGVEQNNRRQYISGRYRKDVSGPEVIGRSQSPARLPASIDRLSSGIGRNGCWPEPA